MKRSPVTAEFMIKHGIREVDFDEDGYWVKFKDGTIHFWIDEDYTVHVSLEDMVPEKVKPLPRKFRCPMCGKFMSEAEFKKGWPKEYRRYLAANRKPSRSATKPSKALRRPKVGRRPTTYEEAFHRASLERRTTRTK